MLFRFSSFVFDIITVRWNYAKMQEYCHVIMLFKENLPVPLKLLLMDFSFSVAYFSF